MTSRVDIEFNDQRRPVRWRPESGTRVCNASPLWYPCKITTAITNPMSGKTMSPTMPCLDTIAKYLLYVFLIDFSLEMLDLIHRIYEADESFRALDFMVHTKLYFSQIILQIYLGTLLPIGLLASTQVIKFRDAIRKRIYTASGLLTLVGIFAMRWNVVIGGQLFSKSFLGYTTYKVEFATREGLLPAIALLILPLIILWVLVKLLPPWHEQEAAQIS